MKNLEILEKPATMNLYLAYRAGASVFENDLRSDRLPEDGIRNADHAHRGDQPGPQEMGEGRRDRQAAVLSQIASFFRNSQFDGWG